MSEVLRDDGHGAKCGHNFLPAECPYDACALKVALAQVERLRADLRSGMTIEAGVAIDAWLAAACAEELRNCAAHLGASTAPDYIAAEYLRRRADQIEREGKR